MYILTINAGSSSVKFAVYDYKDGVDEISPIKNLTRNSKADVDPQQVLGEIIDKAKKQNAANIGAIIHRVVHGGPFFDKPTLIDDKTVKQLESLISFDPLHMPPALKWIHAALQLSSSNSSSSSSSSSTTTRHNTLQIATFDTSYFVDLPAVAQVIPVNRQLAAQYHLRRYGFHGMAHQSMQQQFHTHNPQFNNTANLITLQLGSGCSITAIQHGVPIDTSMGFGPLQGLLMNTRCGDLDPAAILYLMRSDSKLTVQEMEQQLYFHSGLIALDPESKGDMQQLIESEDTNLKAELAINLFIYRIVQYIGGYISILNGLVDGILIGGGIGEHSSIIREKIIERLKWFQGLELDKEKNAEKKNQQTRKISTSKSGVQVWVIAVDEAKVMIEDSRELLKSKDSRSNL